MSFTRSLIAEPGFAIPRIFAGFSGGSLPEKELYHSRIDVFSKHLWGELGEASLLTTPMFLSPFFFPPECGDRFFSPGGVPFFGGLPRGAPGDLPLGADLRDAQRLARAAVRGRRRRLALGGAAAAAEAQPRDAEAERERRR